MLKLHPGQKDKQLLTDQLDYDKTIQVQSTLAPRKTSISRLIRSRRPDRFPVCIPRRDQIYETVASQCFNNVSEVMASPAAFMTSRMFLHSDFSDPLRSYGLASLKSFAHVCKTCIALSWLTLNHSWWRIDFCFFSQHPLQGCSRRHSLISS